MDVAEIFVTLGGFAAIAFVLWFFFGQSEKSSPRDGGRPSKGAKENVKTPAGR